jgi:hypothetical protein
MSELGSLLNITSISYNKNIFLYLSGHAAGNESEITKPL